MKFGGRPNARPNQPISHKYLSTAILIYLCCPTSIHIQSFTSIYAMQILQNWKESNLWEESWIWVNSECRFICHILLKTPLVALSTLPAEGIWPLTCENFKLGWIQNSFVGNDLPDGHYDLLVECCNLPIGTLAILLATDHPLQLNQVPPSAKLGRSHCEQLPMTKICLGLGSVGSQVHMSPIYISTCRERKQMTQIV